MRKFGDVAERIGSRGSTYFEASQLSDDEKERLCRELLTEFGATDIRANNKGEMIHRCVLPWHEDRHPSASLNYKKLAYNCFSCGASGGLLWLIGSCREQTSDQARSWLQDRTGTGPNEQPLSSLLDMIDAIYGPKESARAPIPRMDESVLKPWMRIHPWVTERRHVPEANARRFRVGYGVFRVQVGSDWVSSHRIVLPHFWDDDLVGWQTRRLMKSDGTPKYLSSPDMPKDQTLYNFDRRADEAVIVESPFSVIRHGHHVSMEATFGAKLTDRQHRLVARHRRVILWFDNDEAGWKATHEAAKQVGPYSEVFVVPSFFAADPADMDDDTVDALVAAAIPYSTWRPPEELTPWPSTSA